MNCVEENKKIFEQAFEKYGDDTKSCRWDEKMVMRYSELYKVGNLEGASILDIGCGIGGLYEYFRDDCQTKNMKYKGIDLVEGMIELATQNIQRHNLKLEILWKNLL